MAMGAFLNNWLFFYQIWIALAILFLFLELLDGSLIVCLPLGISASLMAMFVFFSNESLINEWYFLILMWLILSGIISFTLTKFWKKEKDNKDINKY